MLTISQIEWASEHDWFMCVTACNRGVTVKDDNGDGKVTFPEFFNFPKLRAWAGY